MQQIFHAKKTTLAIAISLALSAGLTACGGDGDDEAEQRHLPAQVGRHRLGEQQAVAPAVQQQMVQGPDKHEVAGAALDQRQTQQRRLVEGKAALALGAERPDPEVMRHPPRRPDERLLSWPLVARAYLWLGPLQAAVSLAAFFFVLDTGGWRYGDQLATHEPLYLQATTACLAAIVAAQVVNVFVCRHPREAVWSFPLLENRLLLTGQGVEIALLLLIVFSPAGNWLFGTQPFPPAPDWMSTRKRPNFSLRTALRW